MTPGAAEQEMPPEAAEFVRQHPDLEFVEAFVTDCNGIARGKRIPADALPRLYDKGLYLPASTLLLDIWGNEVEATGLVFDSGDADHPCHPVPGSLRPLPWSGRNSAQLILTMSTPDGEPFHADPRQVLAGIVARLHRRGLVPVVATELEFHLFEAGAAADGPPRRLSRLDDHGGSQLYGLDELAAMEEVFAEIGDVCRAQGLPTDTLIAEQSAGQYEVNLLHVADPLLAADQAMLLKRSIRAVARRHGLIASFMAKPFGDEAGNGLHVHASLVDENGSNVFAGNDGVTETLRHAIGGLMDTMIDATAIFAPHANSYRRFQVGCHVPMAPSWGHDNRTTAVRVPLSDAAATRVEHRVAGADANPYLVLAAILAGIEHGLANRVEPPAETRGSAFEQHVRGLPDTWESAIATFAGSAFIGEYFGTDYRRLYTVCKQQEQNVFRRDVPAFEYATYLGTA